MNSKGIQIAKKITKNNAKTFYLASCFLKKEKRYSAYVVYSFCRITDDTVDKLDNEDPEKNLWLMEQKLNLVYSDSILSDPLLSSFREVVNKYNIPKKYFEELIDGMYMDLEKNRYRNFDELYQYCYKVAGVVGLIMLKIFGYKDISAEKYAIDLGVAMQLTNILRDVKEDYLRGRIYLPQDELNKFKVSEEDIARFRLTSNFIDLLKFQINRARFYYNSAKFGIRLINDYSSRFVTYLMLNTYSGILNEIEKNNYDIFSKRAYVSTLDKIKIIITTALSYK